MRAVMSAPLVRAASTTTIAERERGDDPVARREVGGRGRRAERQFAHERAVAGHSLGQVAVLRRIHAVQAAAEHRNRPPAPLQRALVRRRVHALRQAADHREFRLRQLERQPLRVHPAVERRRRDPTIPIASASRSWKSPFT